MLLIVKNLSTIVNYQILYTNNNVRKKWSAIRQILNRRKIEENVCTIPNDILGKYYETVAPDLAEKLPKLAKDDIPTTSDASYKYKTKNLTLLQQGKFMS